MSDVAMGPTLLLVVSHTCGIQTDGAVVCWGANGLGQSTAP